MAGCSPPAILDRERETHKILWTRQEVSEGGPCSRQAGQIWGLLVITTWLPPGHASHHWGRASSQATICF